MPVKIWPRNWALERTDVLAILDQSTHHLTDSSGMRPIEMKFRDFGETGHAGDYQLLSAPAIRSEMVEWCNQAIQGGDLENMDAVFSTLLTCNFQTAQRAIAVDAIVDGACALLSRLPLHPPELKLETGDNGLNLPEQDWGKLRVFSKPSTNIVRIALFLSMEPQTAFGLTSDYADTIARLLDTASELFQVSATAEDKRACFILQAFLWAAWHQIVMLQLWYDASRQLSIGYSFERHNRLISRQIPTVMPARETVEQLRPEYMCKWAFELLRSDLSSVPQDFRALFEIYERHFGTRTARCNRDVGSDRRGRVCDGKAPGNCQRFESDDVQVQSAHDSGCARETCSFLTWDEASYMQTKGARAIDWEKTDDRHLRYCTLTENNMAVSHVWSHGQGGRPETGFNICLHRRYTMIAQSLGCTSYWMDSPCIPTDDDLRDEAIGQINDNFIRSKVTLLVDRDLMEIDIHPLTLQAEEAILATIVVCDWNVRGWTLLEGMRGRTKLHILCKNNRVISLMDVLTDVTARSNLSLVSACLAIHHYTPTQYQLSQLQLDEPVSTEQATCLLNHRHVTKERDLIVIWSLVCASSKVTKKAADFWACTVGQSLATGFLVSGAPRIQSPGFSWAPARPNVLPSAASTPDEKQYPAFDGQNSVAGSITSEGLKAEWLVCRIRRSRTLPLWFSLQSYSGNAAYYRVYNASANDKIDLAWRVHLRTVIGTLLKKHRWVALLQPALRDRGGTGAVAPPRPFAYQGEAQGPLLVVVSSSDGEKWEWQFVHEWDTKFQLPEFSLEEILIV
ncbi:hypothetical protein BJY04DRAFT_228641 [Aspergillus karnatakaensis]|uniref:HET domain protein n=1 Tax=Aspergillus karnatakaensis TaxID=1810916 RepID=UPI003CCC9636